MKFYVRYKFVQKRVANPKTQIALDEYMWLFEEVWRDRAQASGWVVDFTYDGEDTVLTFKYS